MITMEKYSVEEWTITPLQRAIELAKENKDSKMVRKLKAMLIHESECIKTAYADGVEFALMSILRDEDLPNADEYFDEIFTP